MTDQFTGTFLRPPYRLHPALGIVPVRPSEGLFSLSPERLPQAWLKLEEDEELVDEIFLRWYGDAFRILAADRGARFFMDLSDLDSVQRLYDCGCTVNRRTATIVCEVTPNPGGRATSASFVIGLLADKDDQVLLSVMDSWDGVFLHTYNEGLFAKFQQPDAAVQRS